MLAELAGHVWQCVVMLCVPSVEDPCKFEHRFRCGASPGIAPANHEVTFLSLTRMLSFEARTFKLKFNPDFAPALVAVQDVVRGLAAVAEYLPDLEAYAQPEVELVEAFLQTRLRDHDGLLVPSGVHEGNAERFTQTADVVDG